MLQVKHDSRQSWFVERVVACEHDILCKRKIVSDHLSEKWTNRRFSEGAPSIVSVDIHDDIHILTLMERAAAIRTAISLHIRWRAANQFFAQRRWLRRTAFIREQQIDSLRSSCAPFYNVFILEGKKETLPRLAGGLVMLVDCELGTNKVEDLVEAS